MTNKKGRPKIDPDLKKIPIAFRLPKWIVFWLRNNPKSQNELLETALIKQYKIKKS